MHTALNAAAGEKHFRHGIIKNDGNSESGRYSGRSGRYGSENGRYSGRSKGITAGKTIY